MLLAREGANERSTTLHHLSKNFLWESTYKYFYSSKRNVLLIRRDSPGRNNSLFPKLGEPLILYLSSKSQECINAPDVNISLCVSKALPRTQKQRSASIIIHSLFAQNQVLLLNYT